MSLPGWIGAYEGDPDYEFDVLAIDIGERIVERMDELGLTQAGLARKMGVSRARISQILRGHDNLTLKSVVAVAIGLDSRVDLRLKPGRASGRLRRQSCRLVEPTALHADAPDASAIPLAA